MKNNILAVFMLLCIAWPLTAQYSAGDGSKADPFQITTLQDLIDLSSSKGDLKKHFILMNDIDASATRNITNENGENVGFTPIGSEGIFDNFFAGSFDGQGYTISNLYINLPERENVGFFGFLGTFGEDVLVENLNIENASITGAKYVGVLCGYTDCAVINNCSIDGDVKADTYAGIAAGVSRAEMIKVSTSGTVTGDSFIGGFVGTGANLGEVDYNFYACSSSADVTGTSQVGGFAGVLYTNSSYCYATGDVTGNTEVGGYAGLIDATGYIIHGCFATGDVSGRVISVGGFAGLISASYELSQCYANNAVASSDTAQAVGGFLGNYALNSVGLENNFYNTDISNTSMVDPEGISGITTSALAASSTYSAWDYDKNWEIIQNDEYAANALAIPKVFLFDYDVHFATAIPEAGTVSLDQKWYNHGENITVTSTVPSSPYLFRGWFLDGVLVSAEAQLSIAASQDGTYTALYYVPYSGGEGTEENPYQLSSMDDFILLGETPTDFDKFFVLLNDIDFAASRNMTNADGDTVGFTPIGMTEQEFAGHIDGQGYSIKNLYINLPTTTNVALFGATMIAEFKNLSFVDFHIEGYANVASLVGNAFYTKVTNCNFDGYAEAFEVAGGMCGLFRGVSLAEKCHSSANVVSTSSTVGGLVGNLGGELLQCSSSATVYGNRYVGGLVGTNSGKIQYSYSTGDITGRYCVGGAMGVSNGYARTTFSSASVTQLSIGNSGDDYGYIGGFAGMQAYAYVYNCYAFGPVDGDANQGGFYGGLDPAASSIAPNDCYFDKQTTNQRNRYKEGVTALKTSDFADRSNFEVWDFETVWKIDVIEELSSAARPYSFPSLGYDCYLTTEVENGLYGQVDTLSNFGWFKIGDQVTIEATPNEGFTFEGWYNGTEKVSSEANYTVDITSSLSLVAHFSTIPYQFAGGNGSVIDPYQISNYEELKYLTIHIDELSYRNFILTDDIDASASAIDSSFNSIGTKDVNFSGNFNGQGYAIKDLFIHDLESDGVGFFQLLDGQVDNVTLENVDITGSISTGSLVGCISPNASVSNCYVKGGKVVGEEQTGGLAGAIRSTTFPLQASIFNCHTDSVLVTGADAVGGLFGVAHQAIIESSSSSATVSGQQYVGGLLGTGLGSIDDKLLTITQCSATGDVNATTHAGGLVGYLAGYAVVDLSFSSSYLKATEGYAGGLIGRMTNTRVENSYSSGTVETLDNAGGLIGFIDNNALISNCYTAAEMKVIGIFSGGFCSTIDGSSCEISNSYFCSERTGYQDAFTANVSDAVEILPLSNSEAALEGSFPNFDFSGTWTIRVDSTIDTLARPYLKWQNSPVRVILTNTNEAAGTLFGAGFYANGESITLVAEPTIGWKFSCWKDGDIIVSTSANYTFESVQNATYKYEAVFEEHFSGLGSGTLADPFRIKKMSQLTELSNLPSYWGKSFVVDNDIDASSSESGEGFSPIGHEDIPFTGTFDGQGNSIDDLNINRPELISTGLFGYVQDATISNLTLKNITVEGFNFVGSLVGQIYTDDDSVDGLYTNITNCHVYDATVTAYSISGGLIGSMTKAKVSNSSVTNITLDGGMYYVGGLSGEILSLCEVNECTVSEGSVNSTDGYYVGGFVGRAVASDIYNSSANVMTSGAQNIGGFAGSTGGYARVDSCSASGVSMADGEYPIVGGFVGYQMSSYITQSFATGNVECNDLFGGGFVGYTSGGNSTVIDQCYSTGKVTGRRMIGGFAGSVTSIIRYSYCTGEVDGTINGTVSAHEDIDVQFGGFAGRVNSAGYVGYSYTFSDVKGYILSAGFTAVNLGIIEECYAANTVYEDGSYYSGFAGYTEQSSSNYIKNCYYDYTLSPLDAVSMGTDIIEGLTTEEFASEENMNLSFHGIWQISLNESIDAHARPYLKNDADALLFAVETSHEYAADQSGYGWYNDGQEVKVEITNVQPGLKFTHWEIDGVKISSENPYTFTFEKDGTHSIMAMFEENNILSQGDGSENSPFEISTIEDLICMSNVSSIWDKHFILTDDIDAAVTQSMNSMSGFSPIGSNDTTRFTGSFDGQNHSISNIYISRTASDNAQAFFANVGDTLHTVSIKNLTLDSAIIGGSYGVGVLVGDMINTEVENCNAHGLLIGTGSYVGGLVGRSRDGSAITNSSYKGVVHSPSSTSETATGGLVGYSRNTKIDFCYVIADSVVTWGESVGGLVGYNHNSDYGNQENLEYGISHSFAHIGYVASVGEYTGGIVGTNHGAYIDQCYSVAPIVQYSTYGSSKGAIYGENIGGVITSAVYDRSVYQASSILEGTGITTEEFTNEDLFSGWDFTNDWMIALGEGAVERPYFANMDYNTISFKAGENGALQVNGKGEAFTEKSYRVLQGYESVHMKAVPDVGYEWYEWTVDDKGIWDNENQMTYVPEHLLRDLVLVAQFSVPSNISVVDADDVVIYPNPAQNTIYIEGADADVSVTITNAIGKEVYSGSYHNGIDVSSLSQGVYIIEFNKANKVIRANFIKQ